MVRIVTVTLVLLIAAALSLAIGGLPTLNWLWLMPVCALVGLLVLGLGWFLLLWVASSLVNTEKPQKKDNPFYRAITQTTAKLAVWILRMRVHTKGLEQTPKDGRFLLVCNHLSLLDPVMLLAYFSGSQLAFISKRENNDMFIVGKLMHKLMCQLINRENDREALKTIINCIRLIQEDQVSVAVFPEGYIHGDEKLHTFRSGVFKIAQKTKVPIVVCTLQNTQKVKKNMPGLKPTDVHLHLVGVVQPEEFEGITTVEIANRVHTMMAEDLGPDLVLQETP